MQKLQKKKEELERKPHHHGKHINDDKQNIGRNTDINGCSGEISGGNKEQVI